MAEYISREFMLKDLEADKMNNAEHCGPVTVKIMERFIRYVKEFPAADVQPVPQWISVDDKLPEDDSEVLIYCQKESTGIKRRRIGRFLGNKWLVSNIFGFEMKNVFYWMPLPELPKVDNTNNS